MNERLRGLVARAGIATDLLNQSQTAMLDKIAELIVAEVLDEVADRAYYSDRAWSDELDRPWIELEFGLGSLAKAQQKAGARNE